MKDTLALALVRAELCRTYAEKKAGAAGSGRAGLSRVLTRTLRPFRRKKTSSPRSDQAAR